MSEIEDNDRNAYGASSSINQKNSNHNLSEHYIIARMNRKMRYQLNVIIFITTLCLDPLLI